jgi:ISXO2-like transposase domain
MRRRLVSSGPASIAERPYTRTIPDRGTICTRVSRCSGSINHHEAYSDGQASTNEAESFFSRTRRAEIGHHDRIAGPYLIRYAQGASWREDIRRLANGDQVEAVSGLAMKAPPSVDFCEY